MATLPTPRKPACTKHHIWHASCDDCREQHEWEREEAQRRLTQAAR